MALKKSKEKVVAEPVVEEVVEEVVSAPVDEQPVPVEQAGYIDANDFVYEVKAGKQVFEGMSVLDVFSMLSGVMGKVETVVIKRK